MRPYDANGLEKVCRLKTSSKSTPNYWLLTDGYTVSLVKQRNGRKSTQEVSIPRAEFNRLVSWYMRDQKPVPEKDDGR